MENTNEALMQVLEDFGNQLITYDETIELIKKHFAVKLEPFIGEDYDTARKIILL